MHRYTRCTVSMDKALEWLLLVTHVILVMIQALLSMEKADEICSEDEQALWSHIWSQKS